MHASNDDYSFCADYEEYLLTRPAILGDVLRALAFGYLLWHVFGRDNAIGTSGRKRLNLSAIDCFLTCQFQESLDLP